MLAAETIYNHDILKKRAFTERDDTELSEFTLFPRLQTTALEAAIGSGLFCEPNDRELLSRAVRLRNELIELNNILAFTEHWMGERPNDVATFRGAIRDGLLRKNVLKEYAELGKLLVRAYEISLYETFYIELDKKTDSKSTPEDSGDRRDQPPHQG